MNLLVYHLASSQSKVHFNYLFTLTDVGKALKHTIAVEGVFGLWRGFGSTIFRDVPFSGIYWAIYESLKVHNNVTVPTFWFSFCGGAISGSVSLPIHIKFHNEGVM